MMFVKMIGPNEWRFSNLAVTPQIQQDFDDAMEIWESGDIQRAESQLKYVHVCCPSHIDAIHHLGLIFEQTERPFEAYLCAREGSRLGLDALPSEFSWLTARLSWGILDNRPFMRAYCSLGVWHLRLHEVLKATELFKRLVTVNPNDNQGARYLLAHCYLSTSTWDSVIELTNQYQDDSSPEITYSRALALISNGHVDDGEAELQSAYEQFPLVAKELLKRRHTRPASDFPGYITHGGADQAYEYWKWNGNLWRKNKPAMRALLTVVNAAG